MTETPSGSEPTKTSQIVLKWIRRILFGVIALVFLLSNFLGPLVFSLGDLLLLGWFNYLRGVLPRVGFNIPITVGTSITLALATIGLHRILRWWAVKQDGAAAEWRRGWTMKITAMMLILFATSIVATGVVHQIGWLFQADELVFDASKGRLTQDLSNMFQVGVALELYAGDNDDKLPRSLIELVPKYLPTHRMFFSRANREEPPEWIRYFPNNLATNPVETIVVAAAQPIAEYRAVAYRNGRAEIIPEVEFQRLIQQQKGK